MEERNRLIVERCKNGDKEAVTELYSAYYNQVYFIALKVLRNKDDALDALQETFIEVFKSIDKLNSVDAFQVWLNRIVISSCSRIIKKNKKLELLEEIEDKSIDTYSYVSIDEDVSGRPEENLEQMEEKQMILNMIDKLPTKKRIPILLFYYNNLKIEEIAKILDCPEGTVKSRLNSAKAELKKQILENRSKEAKFYSMGIPAMLALISHENIGVVLKMSEAELILNNVKNIVHIPFLIKLKSKLKSKASVKNVSYIVGSSIAVAVSGYLLLSPIKKVSEIPYGNYETYENTEEDTTNNTEENIDNKIEEDKNENESDINNNRNNDELRYRTITGEKGISSSIFIEGSIASYTLDNKDEGKEFYSLNTGEEENISKENINKGNEEEEKLSNNDKEYDNGYTNDNDIENINTLSITTPINIAFVNLEGEEGERYSVSPKCSIINNSTNNNIEVYMIDNNDHFILSYDNDIVDLKKNYERNIFLGNIYKNNSLDNENVKEIFIVSSNKGDINIKYKYELNLYFKLKGI
ncbi:MAG: sigma-70 family RNA polymerase sigma factor [Clostridium sp.]